VTVHCLCGTGGAKQIAGAAALDSAAACQGPPGGRAEVHEEGVPGVVALPGGHVEPGESTEDALRHELKEELGIAPLEVRYVCTLLHRSEEFRKLHDYAVPQWEGKVENHEAASLRWVPLTAPHNLDLEVDRLALEEYQRVYGGSE
jgi:8-oxo-dGTP diphosphatase